MNCSEKKMNETLSRHENEPTHSSLPLDHARYIQVIDVFVDCTLHQRATVVILDVSNPTFFVHVHLLRKTLMP
jgi:hypothetical protein